MYSVTKWFQFAMSVKLPYKVRTVCYISSRCNLLLFPQLTKIWIYFFNNLSHIGPSTNIPFWLQYFMSSSVTYVCPLPESSSPTASNVSDVSFRTTSSWRFVTPSSLNLTMTYPRKSQNFCVGKTRIKVPEGS